MTSEAKKNTKFNIKYSMITRHNIDCLKLLVNKTFPLTYSEPLYDTIVNQYADHTFFGKQTTV